MIEEPSSARAGEGFLLRKGDPAPSLRYHHGMAKPPSPQQNRVADLDAKLAPLGHFRARPMFGGYGLYLDGVIFGLIGWATLVPSIW